MLGETKTLITRLEKAKGQISGIQRMIKEGRECDQILQQILATINSLKGVALILIKDQTCRWLKSNQKEKWLKTLRLLVKLK